MQRSEQSVGAYSSGNSQQHRLPLKPDQLSVIHAMYVYMYGYIYVVCVYYVLCMCVFVYIDNVVYVCVHVMCVCVFDKE